MAALPYSTAQANDLKHAGYRSGDVARVYGLNLVLVPVNAAEVLKYIEQALRRRKIPFARTQGVSALRSTTVVALWRHLDLRGLLSPEPPARHASASNWGAPQHLPSHPLDGLRQLRIDDQRRISVA